MSPMLAIFSMLQQAKMIIFSRSIPESAGYGRTEEDVALMLLYEEIESTVSNLFRLSDTLDSLV
jgi:hypothetical protein